MESLRTSAAGASVQRFKPLCRFRKFMIAVANRLPFGRFERLFAGNAVQPTLLRKLLVLGKPEAYVKPHTSTGILFFLHLFCGRFFRRALFRRLRFFFSLGVFGGRSRCGLLAFKLHSQLFAEAETLLPTVDLLSRLLRGLFVRAEIKNHDRVCHNTVLDTAEESVKQEKKTRPLCYTRGRLMMLLFGFVFSAAFAVLGRWIFLRPDRFLKHWYGDLLEAPHSGFHRGFTRIFGGVVFFFGAYGVAAQVLKALLGVLHIPEAEVIAMSMGLGLAGTAVWYLHKKSASSSGAGQADSSSK
jgi:hypothetical protein